MKYTDQTIPPELQTLYSELVSNDTTGAGAGSLARTRRKVSLSTKPDRTRKDRWTWAAGQVKNEIKNLKGIDTGDIFLSQELNRLRNGIFENLYWVELVRQPPDYITSTASNTENTSPPPYDYRDPTNKPANVAYPAGTISSAPMKTTGATTAGQWNDNTLTWRRSRHNLIKNGTRPAELPIIWTTNGTLQADTSNRGSAPMFSLVLKTFLADDSYTITETLQPPLDPAISLYYLYDIPVTEPPYYHSSIAIRHKVVLNGSLIAAPGIVPVEVVALTAPRPMLGLGYNNNTEVETIYTDEEKVFQLMPCLQKPPTPGSSMNLKLSFWNNNFYQVSKQDPLKSKEWPAEQILKWRKKFYSLVKKPIWWNQISDPNNWKIQNWNQPAPAGFTDNGQVEFTDIMSKFGASYTFASQMNLMGRNVVNNTADNNYYTATFTFNGCE